MKQFNELSKDDQRLICEVMRLRNEAALSIINGRWIDNSGEIDYNIRSMSGMTEMYNLIEDIKQAQMSLYSFFTKKEIEKKIKRVRELEA